MPASLTGEAFAAIAPELARHGLDLLSGIFRGAVDKGADKVTGMIREKTGIDVQDMAENKLTDEQWVRLKEFEQMYQEQLLALRQAIDPRELEMERLRVEDSRNARETQSKRDASDDVFVRRFTYYYAFIITGATFLFIGTVIFFPPKDKSDVWRVIDTVLGFLLGVGLSAIIQFFYGSSQGSRSKEEQLKALSDRLAPADDLSKGGK